MILEFKKDHQDIIKVLMKIKTSDLTSKESLNSLIEIKDMLIKHLEKEDKHLYPLLLQSSNINVFETAREFQDEMEMVLPSVVDFFEKYTSKDTKRGLVASEAKEEEFKKDLDLFIKTLFARIGKEEKFLYPLYNDA